MVETPDVRLTIVEMNREVFAQFMEEFLSYVTDAYIRANLEPAVKKYQLSIVDKEKKSERIY